MIFIFFPSHTGGLSGNVNVTSSLSQTHEICFNKVKEKKIINVFLKWKHLFSSIRTLYCSLQVQRNAIDRLRDLFGIAMHCRVKKYIM